MIVVADSDILSMFEKAGAVLHLKRLFGAIYIPPAVYEEIRRAKEIGFDFVDGLIDCLGYSCAKRLGINFFTGDQEFEYMQNVEYVK